MKFLRPEMEGRALMPINFQYHVDDKTFKDTIIISYKDLLTNVKYVDEIDNPYIEIYIVKKEYRGNPSIAPADRFRDYIERKYLDVYKVHYKTRKKEAAKILGIDKDQVELCPYVLGIDLNIKTFYFMQFKKEYGNTAVKNLHVAFGDIETEIKDSPYVGVAPAGTVPINVITYIDAQEMQAHTFALYFSAYGGIDEFWQEENLNAFVKELNDSFDSTYGHIDYHLYLYNTEIELIKAFWEVVNSYSPDFLEFWNMPFDMSNIISRCRALGYEPGEIIRDTKRYSIPFVDFREDHNHVVHKRKHYCEIPAPTVILDQMVMYAVIRAGGPKIPSFKLNAIADTELKDKKVEYVDDYGSIADFPYKDYRRFIKYNIKDVLLQLGIDGKTRDSRDVYGRMYDFSVLPNEINTTTTIVANHYREALDTAELGYKIMHCNSNKIEGLENESTVYYDSSYDEEDEENDDVDYLLGKIAEEESFIDENGKRKKFDGAIVLNPTRMSTSGCNNFKYIHDNTIDEDITSEYPSAMEITNLSNETFIGKVILDNKDDIKLPMYNYSFANKDEEAKYRPNAAAIALETFAQDDVLIGAELCFNLPNPSEVLKMLDMNKIIEIIGEVK